MEWMAQIPTRPGWYIWHRESYDTVYTQFLSVGWLASDDTKRVEDLRAFPGNTPVDRYVGGMWYGPIPAPPQGVCA